MRKTTAVLTLAVSAAFVAGLAASPLAQRVLAEAHAEAVPLSPAMIDLAAITHASLPHTGNPELNSRMLVSAGGATISIQSGNIAKHVHPNYVRIPAKHALSSAVNSAGCSNAAKWPPLGTRFQ